jgi:GH15 family glucan-1,4-alpha-glucosidase
VPDPSPRAIAEEQQARAERERSGPCVEGYKPIENYGVIGDMQTVALVGKDGAIEWCCLPAFDSPSVFAAILDARKGGCFKVGPSCQAVQKQLYLPETCVLMSRFLTADGVAELIDFMPIEGGDPTTPQSHQIVRQVRGVTGAVGFELECTPAFDYARARHDLQIKRRGAIFSAGTERLGLTSQTELRETENRGVRTEFLVRAGDVHSFVLSYAERDADVLPAAYDCSNAFEETCAFWRRWLAGCRYQGRWREMVQRSAMTLKLLTYAPTGAIVAAPTTSLPEAIGGQRNWDYRYSWIRDAAFTVYGFIRLGLTEEATRFMEWIDARAHEERRDGSLQVMYGLRGEHELIEKELPHLEGYRGSTPVRIGNGAFSQLQLDIYGELMDAVYLANKYSRLTSYDSWRHLRTTLKYVCDHWQEKDEGIWEVRGGRHHFVYSKLMCWVALDRGLRLADKRSFPADRAHWERTRDAIYEEIMTRGWNTKRRSFVQHYDTDALDASNLIMPLTFFIAPTDPRMQSTIEATTEHLVYDSLVYRYVQGEGAADGFVEEEGTFSMCSFWLVEALTRAGRLGEARLLFEKMLSYANHLGLYSEQIGSTGEALGNFPQAFTHLSLISAAYNLNRALGE